eukprot:365623-Chlamydomonas_euryale.AAC.9
MHTKPSSMHAGVQPHGRTRLWHTQVVTLARQARFHQHNIMAAGGPVSTARSASNCRPCPSLTLPSMRLVGVADAARLGGDCEQIADRAPRRDGC